MTANNIRQINQATSKLESAIKRANRQLFEFETILDSKDCPC